MKQCLLPTLLCLGAGLAHAQGAAPRLDANVGQIPQSAPGAPWSFIGYAVKPPSDSQWFVTTATPRGGAMGRSLSTTEPHTAVLVFASDLLDAPITTDDELLKTAQARHARIGERWEVARHEEKAVRHAGARCARHDMLAREPEDRSPRKGAAEANATRSYLHVTGLTCVHPTEPRLLVEVGLSERSPRESQTPVIVRDAREVIESLSFQRYQEQALQASANAARTGNVKDAEAALKPYIDADAAWARYFLAQIMERATPTPKDAGPRQRALLTPAAERGLTDAQWMLGTLYLRGAEGVPKDAALAEALLRRAAERANPGASFQLGLVLLSGADGLPPNQRDALLWVTRAAARGQAEAQQLLASVRNTAPPPRQTAEPPVQTVVPAAPPPPAR